MRRRDNERKGRRAGKNGSAHALRAGCCLIAAWLCLALQPGVFRTALAASSVSFSPELNRYVEGEIQRFFAGAGMFDTVQASVNLAVDAKNVRELERRFEAGKGGQGVMAEGESYRAKAQGSPGSREETPESQEEETSASYLPDETVTEITIPGGMILADQSTVTVTAVITEVYEEDALREQGELAGTTFSRFREEHQAQRVPETEAEYTSLISRATGIPEENITVMVSRTPEFIPTAAKEKAIPWNMLFTGAGVLALSAALLLTLRARAAGKKKKRAPSRAVKGQKIQGEGKSCAPEGIKGSGGAPGKTGGRVKGSGGAPGKTDGGGSPGASNMSEAERYIRRYIDKNPGEASGKFKTWKDRS